MADFIGDWAVKFSADASGMIKGFQDASRATAAFGAEAKMVSSTIGSTINSALANVTKIDLGQQTAELQRLGSALLNVGAGFLTGGPIGAAVGVASLAAELIR